MITSILNNKRLVNASILLMGLTLLVYLLKQFSSVLMPFTVAIILTFLFVPLTRLSRGKKILLWSSTAIIVVGIILVSFGFFSIASKEVGEYGTINSTEIDSQINTSLETQSVSLIEKVIPFYDFGLGKEVVGYTINYIRTGVGQIGAFFSQLMLIMIFLIFMLPSHDALIKTITKKLKKDTRKDFKETLSLIETKIRDYMYVKSVISFFTAVCSGVVMFAYGVEYRVIFMVLIFLLNFIPNIGSIIAVLIVVLVHFLSVGLSLNLLLTSFFLILIQFIIGNIIDPKLSGDKMDISPIIVLLSLLFWGYVWGLWGMFFSVPLTVSLKILFEKMVMHE